MDVEVQGRADVCMTEDDADGLVVAVALDAACGEAMSQAVKLDNRYSELFQQASVVVAVGSRLSRSAVVGEDVERAVHHFQKWCEQLVKFGRERNFASRVLRLGC